MARLRVGGHILGGTLGGNIRHYAHSAVYVPPTNTAPVASFNRTVTGPTVTVSSTATDADGTITTYGWAWGDGATTTGASSSHTYATAGTYTITHTVTDNGGATGTATASVTTTTSVATIAGLPATTYQAFHRGAGNPPVWPEHTLATYQRALDAGAQVIDIDVQETSDAVLVAFHDPTLIKTTGVSGNVNARTFATMPPVSMPNYIGSGWAPEAVPSLAQVLDTFGGKVVLNVEPKTAADIGALITLVQSKNLGASVLINSNDDTVISQVTAAGLKGHRWGVTTTAMVDSAAAAGAYIIEIDFPSLTQSLVDYAKAKAGVKYVICNPIQTRYQRGVAQGFGVHAFMNDQPGYLDGPVINETSLATRIADKKIGPGWWSRMNVSGVLSIPFFNTDGVVMSKGGAGTAADTNFNNRTNRRFGTLSGPKPANYRIVMRTRYDVAPNASSRPGFRFAMVDDRGDGEDATVSAGYACHVRANGQFQAYKGTGAGAFTQLGTTQTTTAITAAGTVVRQHIDVTPTTITMTRVDDTTGTVLGTLGPFTDSTYRGDHMWVLGNNYGTDTTLLTLDIIPQ